MLCGAGRSPYVRGSVFDIGLSGGHRRGETPVPMPNTVVKLSSADGTARVTVWESRSLPGVFPGLEIVLISGPFLVRVALPHSERG